MSRSQNGDLFPRLPPLSSLRAFESAARLVSFTAAAAEICVTDSAVSHQIHALEAFVGIALFERHGPKVLLTEAGRQYAERIRSALAEIVEATRALDQARAVRHLRISAPPAFAARWLVPRIGGFKAQRPRLEVQILATTNLTDFVRDRIDLALHFGVGPWPALHAERFMGDERFPVCSPQLNGGALPREPRELPDFPLLRLTHVPWAPFLQAAGLAVPEPIAVLEFSDANAMLHAAIDGGGIALARRSIVECDLAAGTLVRLFAIAAPTEAANYIVWPDHILPSADMLAFRDWLFERVATSAPEKS